MYSESDLDAAIAAGALSPEAGAALRNFVAADRTAPAVDEEHFRLLTGFNDIFVSIAAVILLVAVGWIGNAIHVTANTPLASPFAGAFVAATAWGLAEFFTRQRRMALPSIILLLAFVAGVFGTALSLISLVVPEAALQNNEPLAALLGAVAAAAAALGAWLHWRRFKVPITIAAGAAAVVGTALALVAWAIGDVAQLKNLMLGFALVAGIAVFLFAMWWDASDPTRQTRRSDVAFWLHLLAAPLMVHPVFALLGLTNGHASPSEAVIVLLLYVALGVTALAIDRRALLVSALAYVLYALSSLFDRFGAVGMSFALTAFVIGSALLLLSAFWHPARRAIVKTLPAALQAKLPVLDRLSPQPAS
jgi:hypothetical protein